MIEDGRSLKQDSAPIGKLLRALLSVQNAPDEVDLNRVGLGRASDIVIADVRCTTDDRADAI